MRFRQVHLDFHTSEAIPGIGTRFDKRQFQEALRIGHVDSITVFSKCHHGWAYHPSKANEMHPHLDFDLLGSMIEAAHEIGVKTPVYLSAGLDEKLALRHPEWLIRSQDDRTRWVDSFLKPGYHEFCFNTPYLDILLAQIEEVTREYDADGIFLDIVGVRQCCCAACISELRRRGKDPRRAEDVLELGEETYARYVRRVREVVHGIKPGLPIFHNSGHVRRGRRDLARANTHLELESLPTGGWGYDHFPLSARYVQQLGMPFLGMTGKFHTSWGEFGGYKHPNALRYEAALSLANGAGCSIGDQLPPDGRMDEATYRLIGAAYREVEAKEAWCRDAVNVADVAVLTLEALQSEQGEERTGLSDTGAVRMLLEGHILFDVADLETDLTPYRVVVLPDKVRIGEELGRKLNAYIEQGGRVLATGCSGLNEQGDAFALDLGVRLVGENPYRPDYCRPSFPLPSLGEAAFVCYAPGLSVELSGGKELAARENPYFNRDAFAFCSHQHTPNSGEYGGPGMAASDAGIYIAWNVFEDYAVKGSLFLKELVLHALNLLLPSKTVDTGLPAQGVTTVQRQPGSGRYVHHLLYASPVKRGSGIEVIEDIVPLRDVTATLALPEPVKRIYLAPQMEELPFERTGERSVRYTVPEVTCHQMVVLEV
ncbi:alpha-amylase family protein [Cohnella algarum]|uniref:alpha-amylase family protein n=1 Tax=Cohnella algarum TaxID=2044859 RepID=UPI0019683942|nr:alpha-amylase family protein [Cohnella algarum]MBN2983114.1 beta-galactosidase trimerization domain-containing protein [Cohnella algarum]